MVDPHLAKQLPEGNRDQPDRIRFQLVAPGSMSTKKSEQTLGRRSMVSPAMGGGSVLGSPQTN